MSAPGRVKQGNWKYFTPTNTPSGTWVKVSPNLPIVSAIDQLGAESAASMKSVIYLNPMQISVTAGAALSFGLKLGSFPLGVIRPKAGAVVLSLQQVAGTLTSTAGEVGLGTVVGSGANATLGAVGATCENFMEGTTLSNLTAVTTAVPVVKFNDAIVVGTHGATQAAHVDGSATAADLYLNFASTWAGTTDSLKVSGRVEVLWDYITTGS